MIYISQLFRPALVAACAPDWTGLAEDILVNADRPVLRQNAMSQPDPRRGNDWLWMCVGQELLQSQESCVRYSAGLMPVFLFLPISHFLARLPFSLEREIQGLIRYISSSLYVVATTYTLARAL